MRRFAISLALLLAVSTAGCGDGDDTPSPGQSTATLHVALDFTPNPVHAPIFAAARTGADKQHGVRLVIDQPGSRPDSVKALLSGRADIGVLDIQDLAIARAAGRPIVAIGALVQRPLSALITQPDVKRPRDLNGRTVGVSGLPSDPPFVKAIVEHDGGDYETIKQSTIGFNGVTALLADRIAGVPAFWSVEGVILKRKRRDVNEFRIDDYGAPPFPEVVLVTTEKMLDEHRDRVVGALDAIRDGAREVLADPDAAAREIGRQSGSNDLGLLKAQFDALRPVTDATLKLDRAVLDEWADFDVRVGLLDARPDVGKAFVFGL